MPASALRQDPPGPEEVRIREEIEREVRQDLEPQYDSTRAAEFDRARRALFISFVLFTLAIVAVGLPLIGLSAGIAIRVFRWAAGL